MEIHYLDSPRREVIAALQNRDGYDCYYCEAMLDDENRTVDHVIPQRIGKEKGYSSAEIHGIDNLVLSCRRCNSKKADRMLNSDGTLPPRRPNRFERRAAKGQRKGVCETCMSGRILLEGEECPDCGSGPQPQSYPTAYKKEPRDCSHGWDDPKDHCWYCMLGFVERRPAIESVLDADG